MEFFKKPVVIEAFIWGVHDNPKWFDDNFEKGIIAYEYQEGDDPLINQPKFIIINTLEGEHRAERGVHYIIKGVKGEIYPCRPDIFEETYQRVIDPI